MDMTCGAAHKGFCYLGVTTFLCPLSSYESTKWRSEKGECYNECKFPQEFALFLEAPLDSVAVFS